MTPRDVWAGARLAALRKARSLSQRELAELADIDRSRYNALERGREPITLTYAERLAPVFKVTPDSLLPPAGDPEVGPPDPLALLQELSETTGEHQAILDAFASRLEALERAVEGQSRGRGEA